jgi:chromosome segregation ATPase
LREAIVTRDATIRRLNAVLAEKIARERSVGPGTRPQENTDEIMALRELVADLQKHLSIEVRRRERAEQRYEMGRGALSEANAALRTANDHAQYLREDLDAAEAQLTTIQATDVESLPNLPITLQGSRLLYVRGRLGQIQRIRAFVEGAQAEFLHHDGGMEGIP